MSRTWLFSGLAVLVIVLLMVAWPTRVDENEYAGAYRTDDGRLVVLTPVSEDCLRAVQLDGTAARLCEVEKDRYEGASHLDGQGPSSVSATFENDTASLVWEDNLVATAKRVPTDRIDTRFQSEGIDLQGRLSIPPGDGQIPLVVFVGGSGVGSAILEMREQHILAANGIATFVYDKRGAGHSGGSYTQDFTLLAMDAAAAINEAERLLGDRLERTGLIGFSQGGWVGPLAAQFVDVDFLIVGYGLAVSPAEEERSETINLLKANGRADHEVETAVALADAAVSLAAHDFDADVDLFRNLARESRDQGWLPLLHEGSVTSSFASYPLFALRLLWPWFDTDTSWYHDPVPVLESLDIPQLWILAGRDDVAPSETTVKLLHQLADQGASIEVLVFQDAGHGMIARHDNHSHPRKRYVDGYYQAMVDFAMRAAKTGEIHSRP